MKKSLFMTFILLGSILFSSLGFSRTELIQGLKITSVSAIQYDSMYGYYFTMYFDNLNARNRCHNSPAGHPRALFTVANERANYPEYRHEQIVRSTHQTANTALIYGRKVDMRVRGCINNSVWVKAMELYIR